MYTINFGFEVQLYLFVIIRHFRAIFWLWKSYLFVFNLAVFGFFFTFGHFGAIFGVGVLAPTDVLSKFYLYLATRNLYSIHLNNHGMTELFNLDAKS